MTGPGVLAFVGLDGNIWTMAASGAGKRRITLDGTPEMPYAAPAWSRDGQHLLCLRQHPSTVVTFELPDYTPQLHSTDHAVLAAWGPAESELTLARADSKQGIIEIEVIAGRQRRTLAAVPWTMQAAVAADFPTWDVLLPFANTLAWSPRHDLLVLTWPAILGAAAIIIDLTKGTFQDLGALIPDLRTAEHLMSLSFLDDDTLFACLHTDRHAGVAHLTLTGAVQWLRGAEALAARSAPGGQEIYYVTWPMRSPSLWRVPVMGGIPQEVLTGRLTYVAPGQFQNCIFWGVPSFAPAGDMIAVDQLQVDGEIGTPLYQVIESIWLAGVDGSNPRMLGLGRHVAWQPVDG